MVVSSSFAMACKASTPGSAFQSAKEKIVLASDYNGQRAGHMKPLPSPEVPGNTPWEGFNNILKRVVKVPKETILREEAKEKRKREKRSASKR